MQGEIPGGYLGNFHGKFHQFARLPTNSRSGMKSQDLWRWPRLKRDWLKVTEQSEKSAICQNQNLVSDREEQIVGKWKLEEVVDVCRSRLEAGLGTFFALF